MSVNITNINELITPSQGAPSTWTNMGQTEQSACHKYKLAGTSDCGVLSPVELFLEIEAFDPIIYQKTVKSIELAPGKDLEVYKSKDPQIVFFLYGDRELQSLLEIIEMHQEVTFTNLVGSQDEEVHQMTIETKEEDDILQFKITLSFKDAETVSQICCGSYYENAPFNECDGEGETGDPNNDPACAEYEVTIALTEGPDTLTASTVGGDPGVETFTWYKDGVLFGTGVSINPVLSGVYRVDAKKGNCQDSTEFTYSIGCEGFDVTIQEIVLEDGNSIYIAIANLISTYQWEEEIDSVWTEISGETDITFQPDHSGTFRVVATAGECEVESTSEVFVLVESCDEIFTVSLALVDGSVVATLDYEGEGTPSYAWYLDTGSGPTLTDFTGTSIPDASAGYYTVVVTIDGCTQTAGQLVQCEPTGEGDDDDCNFQENWYQQFGSDGTAFEFNVTNFSLPDPAFYTPVQIQSKINVYRNGVFLTYNATPTGVGQWKIDYATQEVILDSAFPLESWEVLAVIKRHN